MMSEENRWLATRPSSAGADFGTPPICAGRRVGRRRPKLRKSPPSLKLRGTPFALDPRAYMMSEGNRWLATRSSRNESEGWWSQRDLNPCLSLERADEDEEDQDQ